MQTSKTNKYLITAVLLGIIFHGTSMFFTIEKTYDALIHLFFANHYATSWFEPWSYSWYTGFTVMGYPPLVHQTIGVLSLIGGLKFGMFTVALIGVVLFITGVYRFTKVLIPNEKVAGYAAIMAVFSSCFVETLHIFGQLPSVIGISILMHALPEIYKWLKTGKKIYLFKSLGLLAITVTSHHVTPIFGMVFFIFPLIGTVLMDAAREKVDNNNEVTISAFAKALWTHLKRIILFGACSLVLIIGCILPYWINTKNNPITQVPIPHGSRDSFIEVTSSGLVFFIIPWGILLLLLPYFFYRYYSKRLLFFGISFSILFVLGTGGTTPIPLMVLGENAFNILTLDRFTLWASIMALPAFGEFCYRFTDGDYKELLQKKWGAVIHRASGGFLAVTFIFIAVFTMTLGKFRPSQPDPIKMQPIVNFLNEDDHDKWRYLPLGFGDQMAWLSAQTKATTVDGNYHSARRLPELTSRAVERLENSKYRGIEGLGSLQQFLTVPEKFHLKYVFSNDKFYDPLLYFTGWHRLSLLENGITVWERSGIAPLPSILPKDDVPLFQKLMWGIIPFSTVIIAILLYLGSMWFNSYKDNKEKQRIYFTVKPASRLVLKLLYGISLLWLGVMLFFIVYMVYGFYLKKSVQMSPESVVTAYYDALDFKEFERAHSYIDPSSEKEISQFMLEISVTDGLLSSYAKMDSISVNVIDQTKSTATGVASISWITPLKEIKTRDTLSIKKEKGKWYIVPKNVDPDIPPDQLMFESGTRFFNHGKRKITSEQTFHEDVLKQPVVEVVNATLVQRDTTFYIVGSIQNVDNIPADIAVTGAIYNKLNEEIARYNAQDIVKHKLLAKETTPFLIEFNSSNDPDRPFEMPENFEIQVKANVATTDLYQAVAPSQIHVNNSELTGFLFNPSIEAATIPQLLISYYNESKEMIWTDAVYVDESVRPQRKRPFSIHLPEMEQPLIISSSLLNVSVNGLPNKSIAAKVNPNRNKAGTNEFLIPVTRLPYSYISISTNAYIGNPR
ncbi:hypothetical protein LY01_01786 [Nonlabens xylanidelens]|uniref:6-pyruvoyl-tetrahydropterin synthase-like protein n=1 Tax=Nonlabens xylanidelens TaxID=191564 RepID=A0A2S6ILC9_9FLAO|nr:hypothetical protein [Nonlabens xylanidelens]PPK95033.1 hypothetical protein LY01_01786 [Nonlabens xylanidelens]PQJ17570.1 hypothetical protein BST94_10995 [Nonlabens xylanidelens]